MAGPREFSTDRFAVHLGLFYAAYFFFGGVQLPFFPLWLEARGLDARTIGLVIAVPMVVRIFATPDHHPSGRPAAGAEGHHRDRIGGGCPRDDGPRPRLRRGRDPVELHRVGGGVFAGAVADRCLRGEWAWRARRAYGPVRLWGSVAFIAGNVGAGVLLQWIAPGHLIWLIVASLVVSVAAAVSLVPLDGGTARPRTRRGRRRRRCFAGPRSSPSRWRRR